MVDPPAPTSLASRKPATMRPLDTLLIQSFPAPPTHIPATPTSPALTNPPPSRPPSVPLPPVPGPSRISGHESILLLSASTRSRRSSRMSFASTNSSTEASSPRVTQPNPSIALSISEEPTPDFTRDDDGNIRVPRQMPTPRKRAHDPNESISSIDVRDILASAPDSDSSLSSLSSDDDDDILSGLPPLSQPRPRLGLAPRTATHTLSLADPIDPHLSGQPLSRSLTFPTASASPRRTVFIDDSPATPSRAPPSPDITAILSKTPRPRLSSTSTSRSRVSSTASHKAIKRRASEGLVRPTHPHSELPYVTPYGRYGSSPYGIYGDESLVSTSAGGMEDEPEDDDDTRSWIDHDEFGKPIPLPPKLKKAKGYVDDEDLGRLERQLEGLGSEEEDDGTTSDGSSLDLHTPLPHLMLRHGLLSPRSKLLRTDLTGRDSVASLASTQAGPPKHPLKDTRDTEQRRTRHRDGRLLKEGLGLTTGLGWSDSEDEDAPSALTRRISALNVSRRSSTATLSRSTSSLNLAHTSSNRLARSFSSSMLGDKYSPPLMEEELGGVDEWGFKQSSLDGHAAQSLGKMGKLMSRSTSRGSSHSLPVHHSKRSGLGPPTAWSAKTVGSAASSMSGDHTIFEEEMGLGRSANASTTTIVSMQPSPSTASSSSVPVTPVLDGEKTLAWTGQLKREKSLPPLPPALRRSPGSSNLGGMSRDHAPPQGLAKSTGPGGRGGFGFGGPAVAGEGVSGVARPRTRTISSTAGDGTPASARARTISASSGSSAGARSRAGSAAPAPTNVGGYNNAKSTPNLGMKTPRPLRLAGAGAPPLPPPSTPLPTPHGKVPAPLLLPHLQTVGDRPAVPVPSIFGYHRPTVAVLVPASSLTLPPTPQTPSTPSSPGTPGPDGKPRPRIGTGMVYRSTGSLNQSRMRVPSTVGRPIVL